MSSYKGAMANYYHEARAQVKKIKTLQEENKKRAERRAEIIDPVAPNPLQQLRITGMSCKLLRGAESHAINESGDNLVPWNGQQDNMIDRFDVRALLDFYKEPDPRVLAARQKSHEELKLEEILRFESYRDLVRLTARGLTEPQGLKAVEQEVLNRRAAEHAAMQAATDQVYYNKPGGAAAGGPGTSDHLAAAAGTGIYSAIGFSYDSGVAGTAATGGTAAGDSDSSDDSSDDDDSDDDEGAAAAAAGPVSEADLAQEAEDERIDDIAEGFGLADFSYRLHKALEKEGEEEARRRKRPKKSMSRKKAANRAKRMAGMGLDPATGLPVHHHDPYKDPRALINPWQDANQYAGSPDRLGHRRGSPSYDAGGWRTRDRSASPPRPGEKQYITEFVSSEAVGSGGGHDYAAPSVQARAGIIEALPDRPDPAMLGGIQPVAKGVMTLQGVKREDLHKRLRQAAEDDSPTYRRRSPTPPWRSSKACSRSRSRSRGRHRARSTSRDRGRGRTPSRHRHRSHSKSRSRSRGSDRYRRTTERDSRDRRSSRRSRSRSRSRSRDRYSRDKRRSSDGGDKQSSRGARSSYSSGQGGSTAAAGGSRAGGGNSATAKAQAAAAAGGPKETAQERLKRLMQAQLNKAAQKDSLANAQKKIQAEKDKVARAQIERVALAAGRGRSPSPSGRHRSRSPAHYRSSRRSYSP